MSSPDVWEHLDYQIVRAARDAAESGRKLRRICIDPGVLRERDRELDRRPRDFTRTEVQGETVVGRYHNLPVVVRRSSREIDVE